MDWPMFLVGWNKFEKHYSSFNRDFLWNGGKITNMKKTCNWCEKCLYNFEIYKYLLTDFFLLNCYEHYYKSTRWNFGLSIVNTWSRLHVRVLALAKAKYYSFQYKRIWSF